MIIKDIESAYNRLAMIIGGGANIVTYVLKKYYSTAMLWK
jgi:hypothetical protein